MAHAQWLEALQAFHATHLARLQEAYAIGLQAVEAKQLPDINAIEPEVLQTTIWTLALATVFIVPQLRRLVLNTVESVLTVILLLLLLAFILAVVLGMPFGELGCWHLWQNVPCMFCELQQESIHVLRSTSQLAPC